MTDSTGSAIWTGRLRQVARTRVREGGFWRIQIAILVITLAHVLFEAGVVSLGIAENAPALHHIPVVLYVIPVTYGGFVYGREGGVLTGVWAGLLAMINVPIWHRTGYDWVFELLFVLVVIGAGVVMALPVERERRQRQRAERSARRLSVLNQLASIEIAPAGNLEQGTEAMAAAVASQLGLSSLTLALRHRDSADPVVAVGAPDAAARAGEDDPVAYDIETDFLVGEVMAVVHSARSLSEEDTAFLATAARQIAIRVENAMLADKERDAMETYVRLVTRAQEEERLRISRDLHDGPAQTLALLVRALEDPHPDAYPSLRDAASTALGEVRRVARDQRPSMLDTLGLVPAIEWMIGEADIHAPMDLSLRIEGDAVRLSAEHEVALYRIAQEALRNAVRHSGAARVTVSVAFDGDGVILEVSDDGQGFEIPVVSGGFVMSGRLGLMGMEERAQLIGGSLEIVSSVRDGTTVRVTVRS